jgi:Sporulation and spore germination
VSTRAKFYVAAIVVALCFAAWGVSRMIPQPRASAPPPTPAAAPVETAHITATLYYGSSDGRSLVPVRREVPLASGVVEQGRQILTVQLQDAPQPYARVVPQGTTLRAFYVTDRGEAFVDLSSEVMTAHPGGSFTELMTVYSIVNAVTANLPAVQRVQLLVDGKEVDTIAGHVDVRRPLTADASLVRNAGPSTESGSTPNAGNPKAKEPGAKPKAPDSQLKTQD